MASTKTTASKPADQQVKGDPANLPAASEFSPSGAPVQTVPDVDPNHPAVDANPRANTSVVQNQIDFNDPTISGAEAVKRNLEAQQPEAAKDEAETKE